jgi:hypothetical protein
MFFCLYAGESDTQFATRLAAVISGSPSPPTTQPNSGPGACGAGSLEAVCTYIYDVCVHVCVCARVCACMCVVCVCA